jgi:hypothetical protein
VFYTRNCVALCSTKEITCAGVVYFVPIPKHHLYFLHEIIASFAAIPNFLRRRALITD